MKQILLIMSILIMFFLTAYGPYNGYEDHWGNKVPGLITNDTWMSPMPTHVSGKAVFYGPYAMEATAEFRGIDYETEGCIGGISLMSPYNIGDKAWVQINQVWFGPFCVVDCAKRGDMYSIVVYREEIVELNFDFAQSMGMVSEHNNGSYEVYNWYLDAQVLVNVPPEIYFSANPQKPIAYKDYFLNTLEFATGFEPRVILDQNGVWKEYAEDKYWHKRTQKIVFPVLANLPKNIHCK